MTKLASLILVTILVAGCAGEQYHREGIEQLREGKIEEGIANLTRAVNEEPQNAEFRTDLYARKRAYIDQLLTSAQNQRQAGKLEIAEGLYKRVLGIDHANARAQEGLDAIARTRRQTDILENARTAYKEGDTEQALALLRPVFSETPDHAGALALKREIEELLARRQATEPTLKSTYTKPINLEFRDANLKMVFEVLARTTGINFILDTGVRPDLRTSVFLKNTSIEDAIELILQTSQLQKKVLSSNTVLVYPNTAEKLKDYQDLVVKAFYLQNADVKQIQNVLKTLLKTKDTTIDEKLNLLVMRDTPEAVRLAEKLVAIHDLAEPEVMLDVEVLEIQRTQLIDLGIQWPNQLTLTPLSTTGGTSLTVNDLKNLNHNNVGVTLGSAVINANQQDANANLLANPRIRVRNREKAKVMVGDKIPVVTTTTTATGLVSDSVQYLDVGLKVDLEPDIRLQDEVAIKVGLEVSSLGTQVKTPSGTVAYQIGTRNANTVLRLKDGETQILAGLINDEERGSGNGVPGLASFPVLGRLFGSRSDNHQKTEIVLSITPHLIRNLNRPAANQGEFWSGTESFLRTKPLSLQPIVESAGSTPAKEGANASATEKRPSALSNLRTVEVPAKSISLAWQGPTQVKVGETFKLSLKMKTDGSVRSLPFQLGFDTTAFQVVNVTEGPFFKQNNGNTSFSKNIDVSGGKVFVSVVRSDVEGADGDDAVAELTLKALATKSPGEIKILAATPIVQGEPTPTVSLPAPIAITVVQ